MLTKKKFIGLNADFIGSLAAVVCAVHCLAFPILLAIGLVSSSHHNHTFDFLIMAFGAVIALYVFVKDYLYHHKNSGPFLLALLGFVVLFIGVESHGKLFFLSIIGGLVITYAHYKNWSLTHS